jgi:hypothetical protein
MTRQRAILTVLECGFVLLLWLAVFTVLYILATVAYHFVGAMCRALFT